jgi:hypothetical protein
MQSSALISIVYVSTATLPFSDADLIGLLSQSQRNNSSRDVTGMLLYKDRNFMQVLEGPEEEVRKLVEIIRADARHAGFIKLLDRAIEKREFSEWSMAFRNLDDVALRYVTGYSEFLNLPLTAKALVTDSKYASRLIEVFRKTLHH